MRLDTLATPARSALGSGQRLGNTSRGQDPMKYLHTMVRVADIDKSLDFYCNKLGLKEVRRMESEQGRFTLIYLAAPGDDHAEVELTYNWDPEAYGEGRNFGHLAFEVEDIYATCEHPVSYTHLRAHETRHDLVCR